MSRESDFHYQLDRAANATMDAACACRSAGHLPLPTPHRRLLRTAILALEKAQDALFQARSDPWSEPSAPKAQQLALL